MSPHELATRHLDLVDEVLVNFLRKNGWAEPYADDLQGAGSLALLEAGTQWPGGDSFRGWARNRIVWAMMDEASSLADAIRPRPEEGEPYSREPRMILSLDSMPASNPTGRTLAEVLPDPSNFPEDTFRDVQRIRLRELLQAVLSMSEYVSVSRVFGLENGSPMTIAAAARLEGVARQTLSQRIHKALDTAQEEIPELRVFLE